MKCLKCKNEDHRVNAKFCKICGNSLEQTNVCTNEKCLHHDVSNPLSDDSIYCDQCGFVSSFCESGILNYDPNHLPF